MRKILIGLSFLGIFTLGLAITYFSFKTSKIFVKNPLRTVAPAPTANVSSQSSPKPLNPVNPEKGIYNILLLGYGGNGHDGALLTDSMIVIHIDTNAKKAVLISIPRDLWVEGNHKINAAGISGFQNSMPAVTNVTGLPINYYVSIDFGGFVKLIDNLAGINVQVPATFDDFFYPITGQENNTCGLTNDQIEVLKAKYSGYNLEIQFTCRYEHLHFDKGPATLDGTTALKFVRSRHGDSDFGRSLRQFAVLKGIENKLISFQFANEFDDIVNTLSQIVRTDLDAGTIKSLIQVFGDPKVYTIKHIQLNTDNVLDSGTSSDGQFILIPKSGMFNFADIKSFISDQL